MGNANGKEDDGLRSEQSAPISHGGGVGGGGGAATSDSVTAGVAPPLYSPAPPLLFASPVPVAPLQRSDSPSQSNQIWPNGPHGVVDHPPEPGIPTIITWNYGGSNVAVEGSWDNWTSRKQLQRSGKDHSILLVLQSGIYHYKFIVDGEWRYVPDLPFVADEMGRVCNVLDVNDYVPEIPESISEFEPPASPDSTYGQALPTEEDFAKEPAMVPSQLHLTVLDEASSSKPQHVVLNHLFVEKEWASQSLVSLGMTHRFESKYVTVVLYKPLKR